MFDADAATREKTIRWQDPQNAANMARMLSGMEFFQQLQSGAIASPPIMRLIGASLVSAEEGRIVMAMPPDESHYNPIGTVHGGVIATLLDSVMGCAVHTALPRGRAYTTLEIKVNYLRPLLVDTGPVMAEGKTVHVGRKSAVAEGKVLDGAGKIYATASTTCLIFEV